MRFATAFIILVLAFYGLYALFRPRGESGPAQKFETIALAPISRGEILNEFRLITVERQYRIPVMGRSYKPLPDTSKSGILGQVAKDMLGGRDSIPGTTTNLVYEMVTTVTMGIDLAKLGDEDIVNGDAVTTLTLPKPEVIAVVHDPTQSKIFAKDQPTLPYMDNSAALLEELQRTGTLKHRSEAENDDILQARAQDEARRQLKGLLEKVHPGREVQIQFESGKNPLPAE
jgi:hypothetical protein